MEVACRGVPFTAAAVQKASSPFGGWTSLTNATFAADGTCQLTLPTGSSQRFFRLDAEPHPATQPNALGAAAPGGDQPLAQTARR
jgi:hypothetical protein